MKINFDFKLENFTASEKIATPSYEYIAMCLNNQEFYEGSDIKKMDLALKIYRDKEVEIDTADLELVRKAVEFKGRQIILPISTLIRGQILKYLLQFNEEKK